MAKKTNVEPMAEKSKVVASSDTGEFNGPVEKRKCHDSFFLILFLLFWIAEAIVISQAVAYGDPKQLFYPKDSTGTLCGVDGAADYPNLYYWNPLDTSGKTSCVKTCPTIAAAADYTNTVCTLSTTSPASLSELNTAVNAKNCAPFVYASKAQFFRCIPSNLTSLIDLASTSGLPTGNGKTSAISAATTANGIISDFYRTWPWIAAFSAASIVVAVLFIILMQFFVGVFVWTAVACGFVAVNGFAVATALAWQNYQNNTSADDFNTRESQTYMIIFIVAAVIAVLVDVILIFMRSRIKIAVQVIKEASKSVQSMPLLASFPIWGSIVTFGLAAYWMTFACYLYTPKSGTAVIFGQSYDSKILTYLNWYHLFMFFWSQQFISGINQMTIAGAVGMWYWSRDKKAMPRAPILKSLYRVFRYHLGSVALGALVIAIIQLIRAGLAYLQKSLKGSKNRVAQMILSCLQCCCACIEGLMKFLNRNAYIEIAIFGEGFFKSAKNAFQLLLRNAFRLVAIDAVTGFILFIVRFFIACATSVGSYFFMTQYMFKTSPLNFTAASVVVVFVVSYMISSIFINVYDLAIETIFLSFCEDCERNDGVSRPYFMSAELQKLTNLKNVTNKVEPTMKEAFTN